MFLLFHYIIKFSWMIEKNLVIKRPNGVFLKKSEILILRNFTKLFFLKIFLNDLGLNFFLLLK